MCRGPYHDGDSTIEARNGSGYVLKQQVWGTQYIDELVQIGVNQDPANASTSITEARRENKCERFFWACQDSNYNVLGVLYATGVLAERYEYTPYGKRTVYSRGWLLGDLDDDGAAATSADSSVMTGQFGTSDPAARSDLDGDGDVDLDDFTWMASQSGQSIAAADPLVNHPRHGSFRGRLSAGNPAVLCEFGHQGLAHDEEFDLVYNRARMLVPYHGRFGGRDVLNDLLQLGTIYLLNGGRGISAEQYSSIAATGPNAYQYTEGNPVVYLDYSGLVSQYYFCATCSPSIVVSVCFGWCDVTSPGISDEAIDSIFSVGMLLECCEASCLPGSNTPAQQASMTACMASNWANWWGMNFPVQGVAPDVSIACH